MTVDARGCSCPQPVLMTKKALEKESSFEVLVDNNPAKNNILRFAQSQGCKASVEDGDAADEYVIKISK